MEEFKPRYSSTKVYSTANEWAWRPETFEAFLEEYQHVSNTLSGPDRLVLYRGQRDHAWLLDSTIARNLKKNWFHVLPGHQFNAEAQNSFELHRLLVSAVLWKFAYVVRPSQELAGQAEKIVELDLMFEMMKHYQQYPEREEDWQSVPGTPLVDWSLSMDIGLFFANRHRNENQTGAVFVTAGTQVGSFHPLVAFADLERAVAALHGATIAIEGDDQLLDLLARMAEAIGGTAVRLAPGAKPAYHAAAVLAAGGFDALLEAIAELGRVAGLDEAGSLAIYGPLIEQTLGNARTLGIGAALTGPMTRGDRGTVRIHLAALAAHAPATIDLYRALAEREIAMALERGALTPEAAADLRFTLTDPLATPA